MSINNEPSQKKILITAFPPFSIRGGLGEFVDKRVPSKLRAEIVDKFVPSKRHLGHNIHGNRSQDILNRLQDDQ
jgi:hypothetical protein